MAKEKRISNEINPRKRFSIVLTNYNSEDYIEDALKSIYDQDYNNIELIITDDCSKLFPKSKIERIINKKNNIKRLKFIINSENIGTVKTLSKALDEVTGEYVLFFASDDVLASNDLLKKYVNIFDENNSINVLTSNSVNCDEDLNIIDNNKKRKKLKKINKMSVKNIYSSLCITNFLGAGSTCFRTKVLKKYGLNKEYKYLEDWPLWLNLTRNNERILYVGFDGLLHRIGGISSNNEVSEVKKEFFRELLYLYRVFILNNMDDLKINAKFKIINSYAYSISSYSAYIDVENDKEAIINYFNKNKIDKVYFYIDKVIPKFLNIILLFLLPLLYL